MLFCILTDENNSELWLMCFFFFPFILRNIFSSVNIWKMQKIRGKAPFVGPSPKHSVNIYTGMRPGTQRYLKNVADWLLPSNFFLPVCKFSYVVVITLFLPFLILLFTLNILTQTLISWSEWRQFLIASLHYVTMMYHLWLDIMMSSRSWNLKEIILKPNSHANILGKAKKHLASVTSS